MGAWGTGIKENDTFHDIWLEFKQNYHQGATPEELRIKFENELLPDDEYHSEVWTAIGFGQWMCGGLEEHTIKQLKLCLSDQVGMTLWAEDPKTLSKRMKKISEFIEKISTPRAKPLKRKKIVLCPAYFEAGDIISIELAEERYTSGLVIDKTDFEFNGENRIIFSKNISSKHLTLEEHLNSNIMYLDVGGSYEYHKGLFRAIFGSRNMKRRIKKTKVIGHINLTRYISLAVGIPIGDWNKVPALYDEQLDYLKMHKTKESFEVSFTQIINRVDPKLQSKLYDLDKKLTQEKLEKRRKSE